jgi:hypothetical protein
MWFWPVNQMPLRPDLVWLTLNLGLIIQCISRFFPLFFIPRKMFSRTPWDFFAYLRLKTTSLFYRQLFCYWRPSWTPIFLVLTPQWGGTKKEEWIMSRMAWNWGSQSRSNWDQLLQRKKRCTSPSTDASFKMIKPWAPRSYDRFPKPFPLISRKMVERHKAFSRTRVNT